MNGGLVLDTGALIALERQSTYRRMLALLGPVRGDQRLVISAGCVAEAWRARARQAPLAMLLRRRDVEIAEITTPIAKAIGAFLGEHPAAEDIVDAHVVMLARRNRLPVVTSDPADLRAMHPALPLITI